ncbi:MAG: tyrosine-type recombinase/integrase [Nodosilinea sp.]
MGKTAKGGVSVGVDRGWLRLRWKVGSKPYTMALGLPDDPVNRALAQKKAADIEADLRADRLTPGAFDVTLSKYREANDGANLSVVRLFERYTEYKRKTLPDPRSLEKYQGLVKHLEKYFRARSAASISESKAFEFRDWLLKQLKPITARERVGMLRKCWEWGQKRKLVAENPWLDVRVKVPSRQKPKPFTAKEIGRILEYARATPTYQHWADLIEFCLSVGCRPGEAAGLKWCHLADDCSSIWVGESFGRGEQKGTKNNKDRTFDLFPELQSMLLERRPERWAASDRVFTAPKGGPINDQNFRRRCWKPLLQELSIPYRKPYNTRHTFGSHAIDQGWSVSEVAAIMGDSEETVLRNYIGNPHGKSKVKRLF